MTLKQRFSDDMINMNRSISIETVIYLLIRNMYAKKQIAESETFDKSFLIFVFPPDLRFYSSAIGRSC